MAGRACDICFIGAATLPGFLAYAAQPVLAALSCFVLMLGGAICGIADPEAPHHTRPERPEGRPTTR